MVKRFSPAVTLLLLFHVQLHAASLKELSPTLSVYSDNRIGFISTNAASSEQTRVWSAENQVLALRFKERLINTKDIEVIEVRETRQPRAPLSIAVTMKTGEVLTAEFATWGPDVEWTACSASKVCENLERNSSGLGFPTYPAMLASTTDTAIEKEAERNISFDGPVQLQHIVSPFNIARTFPSHISNYRLAFKSVEEVSDINGAFEKELIRKKALKQCVSDAMRQGQQRLKEQEEEFVRRAPPGKEAQWREMWSQSNSFSSLLTQSQMGCKQRFPKSR